MATFSVTIPAITCSFPCAIHPNALHLLEVADAWLVDRCKLIVSAWPKSKLAARLYATDHLVNSAFGLIPALFFANAVSEQHVLPTLKLMSWYFMLDNCVDEPGMWGTDPAKSAPLVDSIMAVLVPTNVCRPHSPTLSQVNGNGSTQFSTSQDLPHIFTSTAAEWWADMCVDMPLSQQARFCEHFRLYLSSLVVETRLRCSQAPPDVQTYLRIRSHTLGWYPVDVLTEYTLCIELTQDAIANPLVKAVKQLVCEALMIVNDMASLRKEYESGDYFNIVMALCFQRLKGEGATALKPPSTTALTQRSSTRPEVEWLATPELLQESMNEACEMVKERDKQCVCLIEKIKRSPELMEMAGMGAYLEALGNQIAGNIYWHFASGRYDHCAKKENYKPAPEKMKQGMERALASRTLTFKRRENATHKNESEH